MNEEIRQNTLDFSEGERLRSLQSLDLIDRPDEERFDRITRLCTDVFEINHSAINLIDEDQQWGRSTCGVSREAVRIPREEAICNQAITETGVTVIEDARRNEKTKELPIVTGEFGLRFYAGCPIFSPEELPIGTLCIFDTEPRTFSNREERILKELAAIVEAEIGRGPDRETYRELMEEYKRTHRKANKDDLCKIWNRGAILELLRREISRSRREEEPFSLAFMDIDHFKRINDQYDHRTGDEVLRKLTNRVQRVLRDYDYLGRYGGEEFLFGIVGAGVESAVRISERGRAVVADKPFEIGEETISVTVSVGLVTAKSTAIPDVDEFVEEADRNLYRAKERGRNMTVSSIRKGSEVQ